MFAINPNVHRLTRELGRAISIPLTSKSLKNQKDLESSLNLDINTIQAYLIKKTSEAKNVSAYLDELTWVEITDDNVKETLVESIDSSSAWYNLELEYIETVQPVNNNGIAAREFKAYKEAIEDLGEAISDLTSAVITLPASKEFNDAMKELSNL